MRISHNKMRIFKEKQDLSVQDITGKYKALIVMLWMVFIMVIAILSSFTFTTPTVAKTKYVYIHDTIFTQEVDIPLNDSAVLCELVRQKCVLPAVALAQIKLESSHFKSSICRENKNICGIRTSKSKYVQGQNRGHCVYKTYKDCLSDYIRIQNRYLQNIDGKYAEAKNYLTTLKSVR